VNAVDAKNITPLLAVGKYIQWLPDSRKTLPSDLENTIITLISSGADVNAQDSIEGKTMLHYLAQSQSESKMIDLILKNGGKLELR
jgi:ankyrin repeat protein